MRKDEERKVKDRVTASIFENVKKITELKTMLMPGCVTSKDGRIITLKKSTAGVK